jgi:hypothetical protein
MKVGAPIVWHRPPQIVPRSTLRPLDLAVLDALGAPEDQPIWQLRMRVQEPWTISVEEIGTLTEAGFEPSSSGAARLELWDLPGTKYERQSDGSTRQDPPTVVGFAWICRVVDGDGRVLVEDHWSSAEARYLRRLDDERLRLAKRLARFIFDNGPWGPGRPEGRKTSFDEIVTAIMMFRAKGVGDPSQEQLVEMAEIAYDDVRSLQRALGDLSWQDALEEASQIEADQIAYPGQSVIRGFGYIAKRAR